MERQNDGQVDDGQERGVYRRGQDRHPPQDVPSSRRAGEVRVKVSSLRKTCVTRRAFKLYIGSIIIILQALCFALL